MGDAVGTSSTDSLTVASSALSAAASCDASAQPPNRASYQGESGWGVKPSDQPLVRILPLAASHLGATQSLLAHL